MRFSPTQISLYIEDPEAWRRSRFLKERPKPNIGHIIGNSVHRELADYLNGDDGGATPGAPEHKWGHTWDPGAIAAQGLHLLPDPLSCDVEVRRAFMLDGHKIHCIKDVEANGFVIDHKMVKSLDESQGPEELLEDIQAALYALEQLQRLGTDSVRLRWIWYAMDESGAKATDVIATRELIAPTISKVKVACDKMAIEISEWQTSKNSSIASEKPSQPKKPKQIPLF